MLKYWFTDFVNIQGNLL